jgi:NAD+ synthase (glutamine-hydrolysing)
VRTAVATPGVRVAAPAFNVRQTLDLARQASSAHAAIVVFPELGLSAYSNDDLFFQDALLEGVEKALAALLAASLDLMPIIVVGAPLRSEGKLFNCAVVMHRGQALGVVPKCYLPNYREFYEPRQFASARAALQPTMRLLRREVPFGTNLIFEAPEIGLKLHVEICEDLWVPIPPSTLAALAGATVLANLSASNITIGKADYRRLLCASQSAKCLAGYLYAGAGPGESTTDLAWDGHALIYENGELLAEGERYPQAPRLIFADIDLEHLEQERSRMTSFRDCAESNRGQLAGLRRIPIELDPPCEALQLARSVPRFPYVPSEPAARDERCLEAFNIQVQGLATRLQAAGLARAVIGVSGGLDSTHALLVACKALDRLGLPRSNILGVTMPGFATSARTKENAWRLIQALGVSGLEIDIRPSARQMLTDLDHPFCRGEAVYDVTFENVQAGERTSHLFRLANLHGGLVVGTSDLSELALGYTTYGVGDHMAHYGVNASVPKTLIQELVRWVALTDDLGGAVRDVLASILATAISPELVPGPGDMPAQSAETEIGPYALQDFNLYCMSRFGYRPSKVAYLAWNAWHDAAGGVWPDTIPGHQRVAYDLPTIARWLEVFLVRFFEKSQFKRSAMPNAPKVGSGGSLSPRSDWRAPSDASAEVWVAELRRALPDMP